MKKLSTLTLALVSLLWLTGATWLPLFVAPSGSTLACTYTPVTTGTQNVAYTGATPSASGGVPAYTFSETGALPSGLTISSSTGVISGTPTVSGSFPGIQVKVADTIPTAVNCGASFMLVIAAAPPTMIYAGNVPNSSVSGSGTTTLTLASVPFGTASANRRIFVVKSIYSNPGTNFGLTSATIGSISADIITQAGSSPNTGILVISAPVPTGTSGNVVLNFSSTEAFGVGAEVYYTPDQTQFVSTTPTVGYTAGGASSATATVATQAGGILIAQFNAFGVSGTSFGASTETIVQDGNFSSIITGHAYGTSAHASFSVTANYTGTGGGLGLFSWR
jgi:large repetitive protein